MSTERLNASSIIDRHLQGGGDPDKPAFIAADETLSYADLHRQVCRAGHLLRDLGVGREDRVLMVLDDITAFPVLFLGAQRIGAVPVPVSPMDRLDNFVHYLEDSYAELVVTDSERLELLRPAFAGRGVRYLVPGVEASDVVELGDALAAQEDRLDPAPTHRDDMAFWLYSSGSTGKPKGVVHLQHDIAVTCETYGEQILGLRADDITFSTTKLFHAYGLGNAMSFPLWAGATSVLMRGPSRPEPILSTLSRYRPTVFFSVPALYGLLCNAEGADQALASVRRCVSAAEALPPHTFAGFKQRFGLEILDGIGSTEMLHIYCSNRPGQVVPSTTGREVPGYELRLVDDQGTEIHGPTIGVLEVKGDSCAAFYWHQHDKTKHSMRGEWFSSGDRYERREDGNYVYVGRNDDMLKVGGLWVSPIDMEHVLLEHPRVAGVGVVGVTVDHASRIAAFVECAEPPGDEALAEELRQLCRSRLRRYEYPHVVRFVEALPRTLTGKVQRFKLRELAERSGEVKV
jgi:benzoate-CoA ligase